MIYRYFFNYSETTQRIFQRFVAESNTKSAQTKLKDGCKTRWVERIDGLEVFLDLFIPLVHTLQFKFEIKVKVSSIQKLAGNLLFLSNSTSFVIN